MAKTATDSKDTKAKNPTGGKGRPSDKARTGGKGGKRREEAPRPAGRVVGRSVLVDRAPGVRILKIVRTDIDERKDVSVSYSVEFDGCKPISFERLGAARDRSKEEAPAPEAAVVEVVPEVVEAAPVESAADNASEAIAA